jgi:hypothetical protein
MDKTKWRKKRSYNINNREELQFVDDHRIGRDESELILI